MHDVVSIIHLRRYRGEGRDVRPLPMEIEERLEYEMESVDGERTNPDGDMEYLIRWKEYRMVERTWEPLANLEHAGEAIATWNADRVDDNSIQPQETSDRESASSSHTVVPSSITSVAARN